eukprot:TRINITY_DN5791_c0_g1_i1.p1 TRINITY_DN5791_c0_g1~~TRINITY_DN5791_c0_g1_i1.p1  ORF type:complete len:1102 (+),score=69.28 TRINITY_DN5791_c0_g1_i1:89-3394(+)
MTSTERFLSFFCASGVDVSKPVKSLPDTWQWSCQLAADVFMRMPTADADDATTAALPPELAMFCFPAGLRWQPQPPAAPSVSMFVLTELDGRQVFCTALACCERIDTRTLLAAANDDDAAAQSSPAPSATSAPSVGRLLMRAGVGFVFSPVCLCVGSRLPLFNAMRDTLSVIYRRLWMLADAAVDSPAGCWLQDDVLRPLLCGAALDEMLASLLQAPSPAEGQRLSLHIGGSSSVITCSRSAPHQLPTLELPVGQLLHMLGIHSLLLLYAAALREEKIVFVSSQLSLLTLAAETLVALMYPMRWPHVYIPVLPGCLLDVLQAPTAFIVGLHSSYFSQTPAMDELVVVHLDTGQLRMPSVLYEPKTGGWSQSFKPHRQYSLDYFDLPPRETVALIGRLRQAVCPGLGGFDVVPTVGVSCAATWNRTSDRDPELAIRCAFLHFWASLLAGYESHIVTLRRFPRRITVFNKAQFLLEASVNQDSKAFLSWLVETQAFASLAEQSAPPVLFVDAVAALRAVTDGELVCLDNHRPHWTDVSFATVNSTAAHLAHNSLDAGAAPPSPVANRPVPVSPGRRQLTPVSSTEAGFFDIGWRPQAHTSNFVLAGADVDEAPERTSNTNGRGTSASAALTRWRELRKSRQTFHQAPRELSSSSDSPEPAPAFESSAAASESTRLRAVAVIRTLSDLKAAPDAASPTCNDSVAEEGRVSYPLVAASLVSLSESTDAGALVDGLTANATVALSSSTPSTPTSVKSDERSTASPIVAQLGGSLSISSRSLTPQSKQLAQVRSPAQDMAPMTVEPSEVLSPFTPRGSSVAAGADVILGMRERSFSVRPSLGLRLGSGSPDINYLRDCIRRLLQPPVVEGSSSPAPLRSDVVNTLVQMLTTKSESRMALASVLYDLRSQVNRALSSETFDIVGKLSLTVLQNCNSSSDFETVRQMMSVGSTFYRTIRGLPEFLHNYLKNCVCFDNYFWMTTFYDKVSEMRSKLPDNFREFSSSPAPDSDVALKEDQVLFSVLASVGQSMLDYGCSIDDTCRFATSMSSLCCLDDGRSRTLIDLLRNMERVKTTSDLHLQQATSAKDLKSSKKPTVKSAIKETEHKKS